MYKDKPPIEDFLMHYGKGHLDGGHSGRYPWGSGDAPFQRSGDFLSRVKELRKENLTWTDDRKTLVTKDGRTIDNPDYGRTFTGDTAIAKSMNMSTTDFRDAYTLAKNNERRENVDRAQALYDAGYGYSEIARKMGLPNESSVRSLLDPIAKERMMKAQTIADQLKSDLDERLKSDPKAMIDIGPGVENELRISRTKLDDAIYILEGEGYKTLGGRIPNVTDPTGARQTTLNVLAGPDAEPKDIYDFDHIQSLENYISRDGGESLDKRFHYPESLDSKRLMIRYADQGGDQKDGVIELRRGVEDISLGESRYSQVRILVDNDKYLKGMAVYSDDMPDGIDVIFNTNKKSDTPKMDVLKSVKRDIDGNIDKDNPFGSNIKDLDKGGQRFYPDPKGKYTNPVTGEKQSLSLINKRADEGDWADWQDKVPSQFLSKQSLQLAERQLNMAVQDKKQEYKDIMALDNPTVKKYYLESFASDCDSAAVHLQAAALPRQKYQVILPITSMKDTEVYAPNYKDGEQVVLIRYPHGGTFEIPRLTVNNKQKEAIKVIGKNSKDAIGINAHVASRLSGADFDGDTVMVIPVNDKVRIKSTPPLKDLEGFDPKRDYGYSKVTTEIRVNKKTGEKEVVENYYNNAGNKYKLMKDGAQKQKQMGEISNLITDMTIKGATEAELARAVKHSMVVIDAPKHCLDYQSSERQNGIKALKEKYQGHYTDDGRYSTGASTLISRSKSEEPVLKRQGQPKVNIKGTKDYDPSRPEGALIFKTADDLYYTKTKTNKKTGETKTIDIAKMQRSTKMEETDDARSLISEYNSPMERLYANYANSMKAMANEARKSSYNTKDIKYDPNAAKTYDNEVKSLKRQLDISEKNAPRERIAQIIATSGYKAKEEANPGLTKAEKKKIRQQELTRARDRVGAKKKRIDISDREWEAIQAGAIHATTLKKILNNTDMDQVKERATPRSYKQLSASQINRLNSMANMGYTNAQIAEALGVSPSTVSKHING